MTAPLLEVEGLGVSVGPLRLIEGVSFTVGRGDRMGLIGESGSGKTLTALAIMGLLPDGLRAEGSVRLDGRELLGLGDRQLVAYRGNSMSMIFQEPMTALNPVMRIGRQIAEPLRIHRDLAMSEAMERAVELLRSVGLRDPERRARAYPHELSGGQRQRAMIAMALACGPELVIADEPTTALDVTIQAQVLKVLRDQVAAHDTALILITHDLPVVATVTDSVVVLRDGEIVEAGPTEQVFTRPRHDYTRELVAAVPPMSRTGTMPPKAAPAAAGGEPIVSVAGLTKTYRLRRRRFGEARPEIHALDGVSFEVRTGETFGVVGESGSGKTTLAKVLVGLERPDAGAVNVDGVDLRRGDLAPLRAAAQMVFQDPMSSLDPRMRVGDIIAEPLKALRIGGDHRARVVELLEAVALPPTAVDRYPHEFSGGQRQRIAIARALAPGPRLLIADEPVSALDMSVQTITLALLERLKHEFDLTMIFISHDLSVVHEICERVLVLEDGKVVETGPVDDVFRNPRDEYTKNLIASIPRLDGTFAVRDR